MVVYRAWLNSLVHMFCLTGIAPAPTALLHRTQSPGRPLARHLVQSPLPRERTRVSEQAYPTTHSHPHYPTLHTPTLATPHYTSHPHYPTLHPPTLPPLPTFLRCRWSRSVAWARDTVVRWEGEVFRADGHINVAIPGNTSHEYFYVSCIQTASTCGDPFSPTPFPCPTHCPSPSPAHLCRHSSSHGSTSTPGWSPWKPWQC